MWLPSFSHMPAGEGWQWHFKGLLKFQSQDALLCHDLTLLQGGTAEMLDMRMDGTPCAWPWQPLPHLTGMLRKQN